MTIVWFEKTPKGRGNASGDKAFKITFTDRPKGVRFNVALTRLLAAEDIDYVRMGVHGQTFLIKPVKEQEGGFKLITNKSSAQVCAASIGEWAMERGLVKKRAIGVWIEEAGVLEFNLTMFLEDEADEEEVSSGKIATAVSS